MPTVYIESTVVSDRTAKPSRDLVWNCKHIAGGRVRAIVQQVDERRGIATPVICTPEELMEV